MKIVVGLGNPGEGYARTRHNVGFLVADRLALALGAPFTVKKFGAELAEGRAGPEKVWVMKPQTYMNHSGPARPSASSAPNFLTVNGAPSASASRSATRKPTLWRVRA